MGASASHQPVEFPAGAKATSSFEVAEYYEDDGAYYYDSMSPMHVKGRKRKGEKFLDVTVYKLPVLIGKVDRLEMMIGPTVCTVFGPIERNCLCLILENNEQELARHELTLDLSEPSGHKYLVNLDNGDAAVASSHSGCWYRLVVHTEFASDLDLVFSQSYFTLTMSSFEASLHGGRNLPLSLPFEEKLIAPNMVSLQSFRPWSWKPTLERDRFWWTETPLLTAGIGELEVHLDWRLEGSEPCSISLDLLLIRKGKCIRFLQLLSANNKSSPKTAGHVGLHLDAQSSSAKAFLSQCKPNDRLVLSREFSFYGSPSNDSNSRSMRSRVSPRTSIATPRCVVSNLSLVFTSNQGAVPCWTPARLLPNPTTIAPELHFLFPSHRSAKATKEKSLVRSFSTHATEDLATEDFELIADSNSDDAKPLVSAISHYSAVTTVATDYGGVEDGDSLGVEEWTGAVAFQHQETSMSPAMLCWTR